MFCRVGIWKNVINHASFGMIDEQEGRAPRAKFGRRPGVIPHAL